MTPILRAIPSTDETIPALGLGTWQAFDVGDPARRGPLRDVLRRFVDLGGRVVDSSPMYGAAEGAVGDLAADLGVRDTLWVATKVWTTGAAAGVAQMDRSLQLLRGKRLDLMQVHNLVDVQTHLKTLRAWKDAGRIRYLGVTHYSASGHDALERLMRREPLDFVQLNYSLAEPEAAGARPGHRGARQPPARPGCARFPRARPQPARVGGGNRLRVVGPALSQVDPGPPGRDLRDPGHQPRAAPRGQHAGGRGTPARRGRARAHYRAVLTGVTLREAVSAAS